jgi:hypothetical protein
MDDQEVTDRETGEILETTAREVAANGDVLPAPSSTAGTFLDLLEDGEFGRDAYEKLRDAGLQCKMIGERTGGKAKAKVKIEVELEYQDGQFKIAGAVSAKLPELPRPRSVLWMDGHDDFTRFPPRQMQMFGANRPLKTVS